ncbi:MAG: TfoX/Sxy family protein [Acidobacteria bacterium]|nr:TfoX/Sxy family protein [Acidobacteriota bacterium]
MEKVCAKDVLTEKRMFGGLGFMVNGNMACGIIGDKLMVRVGPPAHDAALAEPHTSPMDFTGRPMTGYIYVHPPGTATAAALQKWARMGAEFVRSLPARKTK